MKRSSSFTNEEEEDMVLHPSIRGPHQATYLRAQRRLRGRPKSAGLSEKENDISHLCPITSGWCSEDSTPYLTASVRTGPSVWYRWCAVRGCGFLSAGEWEWEIDALLSIPGVTGDSTTLGIIAAKQATPPAGKNIRSWSGRWLVLLPGM